MTVAIDMTGQRIGQMTVVGRAVSNDHGHAQGRCRCDCGEETVYSGNTLRFGNIVSCGCAKARTLGARSRSHGHSCPPTPAYRAWANMIGRTRAAEGPNAEIYFNRGITVCDRWLKFENFLADMGEHPGAGFSLDRIDNDRGYEPGCCRWATASQQRLNQRHMQRKAA